MKKVNIPNRVLFNKIKELRKMHKDPKVSADDLLESQLNLIDFIDDNEFEFEKAQDVQEVNPSAVRK